MYEAARCGPPAGTSLDTMMVKYDKDGRGKLTWSLQNFNDVVLRFHAALTETLRLITFSRHRPD